MVVKKIAKEKKEKEKTPSKKLSEAEFEKIVVDFADKGSTSEKIGELLRKQGIHPKEHGKKISKILKEKNKYENPDVKNVAEKLSGILKHMEKNHQDKRAMRDKDRIFAHLRKLKMHFKIR